MAWPDVISHAKLFKKIFIDQPLNPWQMLAEPLGSAEPRLKITAVGTHLQGSMTQRVPATDAEIWEVKRYSPNMQLQIAAKPSVLCCMANTNEKLGELATAIPPFVKLLQTQNLLYRLHWLWQQRRLRRPRVQLIGHRLTSHCYQLIDCRLSTLATRWLSTVVFSHSATTSSTTRCCGASIS